MNLGFREGVTLRRRMNPRSFFCHSSVRDALRNGAWLRLGAHRRDEWPTASAFGILGTANTRAFRRCSLRNVPTRAEAFPELFLDDAALPKAGAHQMSSYLRSVSIAWYIWNNTVVFLPVALRHGTRTLFSFQGATVLFYQREEKAEMQGSSLRETRLTAWVLHRSGLRRAEALFCQGYSLMMPK